MSRIVIDARELRTSTGRYIERLLHYLQRTESEHEFVVLLKPKDFDSWEPGNPRFSKVECPYEEFTFSEQMGYLAQLNSLDADLVHFGMTQQPIAYKGPVVTTIHDLTTLRFENPDKNRFVFKFKQGIYAYVTKHVAKKSRRIITPTNFVKSDLVKYAGISPDKVIVTHEAADFITESPSPLPDLQNHKFIMYVGRPTPHKNLERLIEAFTLLRAQHPSLRLVLAGKKDANYTRIENSIKQRGLKNIYFTDFVTDGQLRWLYENCQAYVFPSLSEGFGLPGLEAMQHGAPVVSSNATCLPEVYGNAAHYFDPENTQSMSDAINEVLTNKDLKKKLVAAGTKKVEEYSWQKMTKETLEVYDKVLKANSL